MNLEAVMLSELSQTETEKHSMTSYMWNLKGNDTNELIYKIETSSHT